MRKNNWLLGGIFLGIIFFLAVFLVKPIGVSTQFSVLSGKIHTAIAADIVAPVPGKPGEYKSTGSATDTGICGTELRKIVSK